MTGETPNFHQYSVQTVHKFLALFWRVSLLRLLAIFTRVYSAAKLTMHWFFFQFRPVSKSVASLSLQRHDVDLRPISSMFDSRSRTKPRLSISNLSWNVNTVSATKAIHQDLSSVSSVHSKFTFVYYVLLVGLVLYGYCSKIWILVFSMLYFSPYYITLILFYSDLQCKWPVGPYALNKM